MAPRSRPPPLPSVPLEKRIEAAIGEIRGLLRERNVIGRISPEKRVDRAIQIARRAGMPLRIAAKVDDVDRAYYEEEIEPLLDSPHVDLEGEVSGADKQALFSGARALLFPIDWPEPFGLVLIESLVIYALIIALLLVLKVGT